MWSAYLFQVTTGQIGPRLHVSSMSWKMTLNATESISINLQKSDLPNVDLRYWLAPWWSGVVLMWNNVPFIAGPILSRPVETFTNVSLEVGGIRSILAHRAVCQELSNWSSLAKTNVKWTGLSLGTIANKMVQMVQEKHGGSLPISYPIPDETHANDANHSRTYWGFDLQNIMVDDCLNHLSNVNLGPDVMFKPRMISDTRLTFDFFHGSEGDPRIDQSHTPLWDTTVAISAIENINVQMTGTYQTSRVFSMGAGTDTGKYISVVTNNYAISKGFPLLETVINPSNSDNRAYVSERGISSIKANADMLQELQMDVMGDDSINYIGSFWPGDLIKIKTAGFISIPDGINDYRLLSMSGDTTSKVQINAQTEARFLREDIIVE